MIDVRVLAVTDKLLDDLNDRSGFSLDADTRGILRSDWIVQPAFSRETYP